MSKLLEVSMANVEIYTWSTCPFCRRAKQLLNQKGVTYTEYDIDDDEAARDAMVARGTNGQRTVPQIFINDQHIGGSDDLYQLGKQGKLDALLSQTIARS
jgi:glutaredoxin 3